MARSRGEAEVSIAAKLYDMRRAARVLSGDDYTKRVGEYKRYLVSSAEEHGLTTMEAFLRGAKLLVAGEPGSGAIIYLGAACVDLIEKEGRR